MIKINEVDKYIDKPGVIIVDLRSANEYKSGHIKGAVNIPFEEGKDISRYLMGYRYVFLYCQRGSVSLMTARNLRGVNAKVYNLCGGLRSYYGKLVKT
jgi:rhodanese-related sulfurtransferase